MVVQLFFTLAIDDDASPHTASTSLLWSSIDRLEFSGDSTFLNANLARSRTLLVRLDSNEYDDALSLNLRLLLAMTEEN